MPAVTRGTVICSSSGWSHAIRTAHGVRKVVYCHNPARWLYQGDDYFRGQPRVFRFLASVFRPLLMKWDMRAAKTADVYIANSSAVASRIRHFYGRDAHIIHPPISLDHRGERAVVSGIRPGFFISVGRGRGYKNLDKLVRAFDELPSERLVIVGATLDGIAHTRNVTALKNVSDSQLRWLYANAAALLSVSHEDFGLTPLEANAFGTPCLVLRAGGFLDSVHEHVSGEYIPSSEAVAIADAIRAFPRTWDADILVHHAKKFMMPEFLRKLDAILLEEDHDDE